MRKLTLILCVLLCLSFALCACSEQPVTDNGASTETIITVPTQESNPPTDDGKVTYTVYVVDEEGKPVTGGMVQFCLDVCMPSVLDANGVATMRLVEGNYKVAFTMIPAGYQLAGDETEFYFEDGSYEMTITLKAAG